MTYPTPFQLAELALRVQLPQSLDDEFYGMDEPEVRAILALGQFRAAVNVLESAITRDAETDSRQEVEQEFLHKLGEGDLVSLEVFLQAMLGDSKTARRREKWKQFQAMRLREQQWFVGYKDEQEFLAELDARLERNIHTGIDRRHILGVRSAFLRFLATDDRILKQEKAAKSHRAKTLYDVARDVLSNDPLTRNKQTILKGINPAEVEQVAQRLELAPKDLSKWRAAVESAKAPKNSKPRRILKKSPDGA
jgi:hypothetical protein